MRPVPPDSHYSACAATTADANRVPPLPLAPVTESAPPEPP